jgi:hypothetical protein
VRVKRCLVPVIGGLNLYVVPQGAGCSDLLQCLPDVGFLRSTSPSNGWAFSRVQTRIFVAVRRIKISLSVGAAYTIE